MKTTYQKQNSSLITTLLIGISFVLLSCNNQSQDDYSYEEKNEIFNSITLETDRNKSNEEWKDNMYRNYKYKFRLTFPDSNKDYKISEDITISDWEYLKGDGKEILAKSINREYGITISTLVKHLPTNNEPSYTIWDNSISDFEKIFKEGLKLQNIKPKNLSIEKGSLFNFNAYIVSFNADISTGDETIEYFSKTIQTIIDNKVYNVSIILPTVVWEHEEMQNIFRDVVWSYRFEKAI
ncbi:MAG: hypothetical protein KF732_05245 [Flavobacteriales bacterium]|nr:hypothetical protein [Flavobacteriales bacterium]